jgi:hypothetical protein
MLSPMPSPFRMAIHGKRDSSLTGVAQDPATYAPRRPGLRGRTAAAAAGISPNDQINALASRAAAHAPDDVRRR